MPCHAPVLSFWQVPRSLPSLPSVTFTLDSNSNRTFHLRSKDAKFRIAFPNSPDEELMAREKFPAKGKNSFPLHNAVKSNFPDFFPQKKFSSKTLSSQNTHISKQIALETAKIASPNYNTVNQTIFLHHLTTKIGQSVVPTNPSCPQSRLAAAGWSGQFFRFVSVAVALCRRVSGGSSCKDLGF